jgi:hypothetical protein
LTSTFEYSIILVYKVRLFISFGSLWCPVNWSADCFGFGLQHHKYPVFRDQRTCIMHYFLYFPPGYTRCFRAAGAYVLALVRCDPVGGAGVAPVVRPCFSFIHVFTLTADRAPLGCVDIDSSSEGVRVTGVPSPPSKRPAGFSIRPQFALAR